MNIRSIPEKQYEVIAKVMPILTVDLILKDKKTKKYILLRRSNSPLRNFLWTPGGRVFKNENFDEAASRKTEEEVGIKISPEKFLFKGVLDFRSDKHRFSRIKDGLHTVSMVYECMEYLDSELISVDPQSESYELSDHLPYVFVENSVNQFIEE